MIIGAPYMVTENMIEQCKVKGGIFIIMGFNDFAKKNQCDFVVHGNTPVKEDIDGQDPYEVHFSLSFFPRAMHMRGGGSLKQSKAVQGPMYHSYPEAAFRH